MEKKSDKRYKRGETARLREPITTVRVIDFDSLGSVLVSTGPLSGWINVKALEEEE